MVLRQTFLPGSWLPNYLSAAPLSLTSAPSLSLSFLFSFFCVLLFYLHSFYVCMVPIRRQFPESCGLVVFVLYIKQGMVLHQTSLPSAWLPQLRLVVSVVFIVFFILYLCLFIYLLRSPVGRRRGGH